MIGTLFYLSTAVGSTNIQNYNVLLDITRVCGPKKPETTVSLDMANEM